MTYRWINPSSTKHTIHSVPWRDWFPPYSDASIELRSRHHTANLSLVSWTLNSFFFLVCVIVKGRKKKKIGTPLTTRVQAHVPACKTKSGLIKKWIFFPDKWLVAMVIFDMTAHPFSPFFTFGVTSLFCLHQSEARKIQHGRLFCLLHQSDFRGCVCKLNVKIP